MNNTKKSTDGSMIAPCGIDCKPCVIRRFPFDKHAQRKVIEWFKLQGWLTEDQGLSDILDNEMYCKGCRSDRNDVHWSPDCFILQCCVFDKHLTFCYECPDFICDKLQAWANKNERYAEALANLLQLASNLNSP